MKDLSKKTLGMISFIPGAAFLLWIAYLLILNNRLVEQGQLHQHDRVVSLLFDNYGGVSALFLLVFMIGLAVLVAMVVHLKKVRTMNGATKLAWIAFLVIFAPFSFPVYYYIEVRHEPDDVPMYASLEEGMG
jgi:hypothetical protein